MFKKPTVFSDESGSQVLGKDGSIKASFSVADHGASHEGAAVSHLQQNFDDYMAEANYSHRAYASHGLMHPDMAKDMNKNDDVDYYLPGTGDKHYGTVTKNDGASVHIRAYNKSGKNANGPLHKFKVTPHLPTNEEVEQMDEISSDMAHRYLKGKRERDYDISADGKSSKLKKPQSFGKMNKDMKSTARALRTIEKAKKTNEEVEIDEGVTNPEIKKAYADLLKTPGGSSERKAAVRRYKSLRQNAVKEEAGKQHIEVTHVSGQKSKKPVHPDNAFKALNHYKSLSTTKSARIVSEDAEQIDELSKDAMLNYLHANKHKNTKDGNPRRDLVKSMRGTDMAVRKYTGSKSVRVAANEEVEQMDELSKETLGSYIKKASGAEQPKNVMSPKNLPLTKIAAYQGDSETGHFGKRFNQATYDKAERLRKNRETGITRAADKLAKEAVDNPYAVGMAAAMKSTGDKPPLEKTTITKAHKIAKEVMKENKFLTGALKKLEEGRGRPAKEGSAAWHRQQAAASAGKPKEEPVALGMQLRKAASINSHVEFDDGKKHEIHPKHITAFNDHMAARRTTQDKAAFQKKASASHDAFVKAVSEPTPAHKDSGDYGMPKYR